MSRILIVVTSHAQLGTTDRRTGYYLDELAIPYYAFTDKGFDVDIASPAGGAAPVDPGSMAAADDPTGEAARFMVDPQAQALISQHHSGWTRSARTTTLRSSSPAATA